MVKIVVSRGEDADDTVTQFDENTECWSTMDNQILTCLFGITPSLALVCVLKDDVAEKRGQLTHNLLSFRQAVRGILRYWKFSIFSKNQKTNSSSTLDPSVN